MRELTDAERSRVAGYVLVYIDSLERKIADLEGWIAEKVKNDTNVWQRSGLMLPDSPLEKNAEIRFDMGGPDESHEDSFRRAHHIDVRHDAQEPSMLVVNGASRLLIHPWASNHFYVTVAPR